MRKVCAAAILALASGLGIEACAGVEVEKAPGETRPFVEAVLPVSQEAVVRALHRLFNDGLDASRKNKFPATDKLHEFLLFPNRPEPGAVTIPADVNLRANARNDPAMERYLALSPEARSGDFFLYHPLDVFWPSEYQARGRPVEFTTDFILHLEPAGPAATRVEVLEFWPRVRAGKRFGWSSHGVGPGTFEDIRTVPPTTRDRVELLERIAAAVRQG